MPPSACATTSDVAACQYRAAPSVGSPVAARESSLVNGGVDFVKVYTRMDPALLSAVLDEAKTFNLRLSGHLGLTDALTAAGFGAHVPPMGDDLAPPFVVKPAHG